MAEHIVSSVTSAVTGEVARELIARLMGKLDRHGAAAATDKKLRRLELLLIKIHSAVEASEKHSIENAWLITWRDKLKEAAAEGDEVLASFRQQEVDPPPPAAAEATGDGAAQQQQQEHPASSSSSASAAATTSAATRNAPLGMAQKKNIRSATASNEDMDRLNSAVERLEELSPEIATFIKLLKLEVLKPEQTSSSTGNRRKSDEVLTPGQQTSTGNRKKMTIRSAMRPSFRMTALRTNRSSRSSFALPIDAVLVEIEAGMMGALPAHSQRRLLDRLMEAFAPILRSIELANDCDMTAHVWLANWASILREAKDQVGAVIFAISAAHRDAGATGEEVEVVDPDDYREEEEDSEFGRFVRSVESLAGEADCFSDLACLCPSYSY